MEELTSGVLEKIGNLVKEAKKEQEEAIYEESKKVDASVHNIKRIPKTIFNKQGRGRPKMYGTPRNEFIGKMRATGMSCEEIGKEVGLTKVRIQDICRQDDVKTIIEREQARLASFVPQAVKNMEHWITKATETTSNVDKRIGFEATKELLQSTGILNNQPSHLVQILYNDHKTIINPLIQGLLDNFVEKLKSADIIDAEFQNVEEVQDNKGVLA